MPYECKCPKCGDDHSEDATQRCGAVSEGTAFIHSPAAKGVEAASTVALYCAKCELWFECDCPGKEPATVV